MTTAGLHSPPESRAARRRRLRALSNRQFDRVLLIKPSSLGDVIHALPVLHGLRSRYPAAKIDWLISSSLAPLLAGHPELNELVLFDRRKFGRMVASPTACADFLTFLGELRRRRYQLVIDLQGLFRSGFIAWATRASVRLGFREAREGARFFYTDLLEPADDGVHAVDRNYCVAHALNFADVPVQFELGLADADRGEAERLLSEAGVRPGDRLIAVAPGARWETKIWAADRFVQAVDLVQAHAEHSCVLLGGPDEVGLCSQIAAGCRRPPANLAGRTGLRALAAIVERAELVLCLDSGVMHIAAALHRPLVCLTGPTNPARTGPYRRLQDVIRLDLPCSPCYLRQLHRCPHQHRCMRDLPAGAVAEAISERLAGAVGAARPVIVA